MKQPTALVIDILYIKLFLKAILGRFQVFYEIMILVKETATVSSILTSYKQNTAHKNTDDALIMFMFMYCHFLITVLMKLLISTSSVFVNAVCLSVLFSSRYHNPKSFLFRSILLLSLNVEYVFIVDAFDIATSCSYSMYLIYI